MSKTFTTPLVPSCLYKYIGSDEHIYLLEQNIDKLEGRIAALEKQIVLILNKE